MAFLDALFQDVQEAPDTARKLYGFLTGQGQTSPAVTPPFVANPPQTQPVAPLSAAANTPPAATPRPKSTLAAPSAAMAPVTLGTAAPPATSPAILDSPVTLGQPAIPAPPPKAKPTGLQRFAAATLGLSGGMRGNPNEGSDYIEKIENQPIADYNTELQRGRQQVQDIQAADRSKAEFDRSEAEARNLEAEAQNRLNPPPKPAKTRPVVIAAEDGTPTPAVQNLDTGGITDADGNPVLNPKMWEKPAAPAKLSDTEQAISDEIAGNPTKYPGGNIASNRAKARQALKAETPEKPTADDKAISDHLAAQGLPNTPANRDKARNDIAGGKVAAAAEAKGTAQKAQLRESAEQGFKNMNALYKQDTDPANYGFLMSFIGMMYEGIRGARLNRAEIERAAATRSLPDQLQSAYDLYIQKRVLTSQQKDEMLAAATAVAGTYGKVQRNKRTGEIRIVDEQAAPAAAPPAAAAAPKTITINPDQF